MKYFIAIVILAIAAMSWAGSTRMTTTKIGDTEYHRFSDGTRGTTTRIGDTEYHRFSDGTRGTTTRIGDTEYHRFSTPDPVPAFKDSSPYSPLNSPYHPKNSGLIKDSSLWDD
jgi:hypothetical protein